MDIQDILVVYMKPKTAAAKRTLEVVKNTLLKEKAAVLIVERNRVDKHCCWKKDLVITVGGDGTFLRASHFVEESLLWGINPDPKRKVGFFTRATAKDFAAKFTALKGGRFRVKELPRLKVQINGRILPERAVNEVFFGDRLPYKMCRYKLQINRKSEEQRSSGVLLSTGAGSHAWMQSVGGKVFPITAEKIEYLVREPYHLLNRKGMLWRGFVGKEGKIRITSRDTNNFLVIDGLSRPYSVPAGKTATVTLAKRKLRLVEF